MVSGFLNEALFRYPRARMLFNNNYISSNENIGVLTRLLKLCTLHLEIPRYSDILNATIFPERKSSTVYSLWTSLKKNLSKGYTNRIKERDSLDGMMKGWLHKGLECLRVVASEIVRFVKQHRHWAKLLDSGSSSWRICAWPVPVLNLNCYYNSTILLAVVLVYDVIITKKASYLRYVLGFDKMFIMKLKMSYNKYKPFWSLLGCLLINGHTEKKAISLFS